MTQSMDASTHSGENANAPRDWAMIVDDDDPFRALVTTQFLAMDLEAVAAAGGELALEIARRKSTAPLLILVDVMMPGMDGLTLARKLRAHYGQQTRVVIVSGHLSDESWWPVDLREITFLPKPFRLADLKRLVDEARAARPVSA